MISNEEEGVINKDPRIAGIFYCKYSASSQNSSKVQHKQQGKADQIDETDDGQ